MYKIFRRENFTESLLLIMYLAIPGRNSFHRQTTWTCHIVYLTTAVFVLIIAYSSQLCAVCQYVVCDYSVMNLIHRELSLRKGDTVYLLQQIDKNWFKGERHGTVGIFPVSHIEVSEYMQVVLRLIVKLPAVMLFILFMNVGNLQFATLSFVLSAN